MRQARNGKLSVGGGEKRANQPRQKNRKFFKIMLDSEKKTGIIHFAVALTEAVRSGVVSKWS